MNIFLITSVPIAPPWDQGDKNLAYALATALPAHRFRVLTYRGGPVPEGDNLEREPLYRSRQPSFWQKARVYWRLLGRPLAVNGWAEPDLYHFIYRPYALSSWLCRLMPEFRRRPTLHTVPATADGRSLGRHLFFADRLVVLSEHGRQVLARLGLTNTVQIPPAIPVAHWAALRDQTDRLKAQLGVAGHPVLLYPGHYSPGYGADLLLRALPAIAAQVPDLRVLLACRPRSPDDEAREAAARQAVAQMGLAEAVRFYNVVPDMRLLIGASDLVLLPLETMRDKVDIPITLLEALAAGKPIVISDLPPMSELVRGCDDEIGLVVPPGDADALAQAVIALLTDAALRRRMGERGTKLAWERFDIRQVARQYETLYTEMVQ